MFDDISLRLWVTGSYTMSMEGLKVDDYADFRLHISRDAKDPSAGAYRQELTLEGDAKFVQKLKAMIEAFESAPGVGPVAIEKEIKPDEFCMKTHLSSLGHEVAFFPKDRDIENVPVVENRGEAVLLKSCFLGVDSVDELIVRLQQWKKNRTLKLPGDD